MRPMIAVPAKIVAEEPHGERHRFGQLFEDVSGVKKTRAGQGSSKRLGVPEQIALKAEHAELYHCNHHDYDERHR